MSMVLSTFYNIFKKRSPKFQTPRNGIEKETAEAVPIRNRTVLIWQDVSLKSYKQ